MEFAAADHGLVFGSNAPGYTRSSGLHMSTIYNDLYGKLYPKKYATDGPMPTEKWEAGMIWEEQLEAGFKARPGLAEVAWRPGESRTTHEIDCPCGDTPLTDDIGICPCCGAIAVAYSPDLIISNGSTKLGEIKLTWYSCRYAPISKGQAEAVGRPDLFNGREEWDGRFDKWFTQIKAYCYHQRLLEARLIVLFINGNYTPPSPVPLAWDLQFTQRELDEEWTMLKNHAVAQGLVKR